MWMINEESKVNKREEEKSELYEHQCGKGKKRKKLEP